MVTFAVDDVTPAASPLPTRPVGGLFPDALAYGGDPALPVIEPDGVHPLLSAVARAFADHRPLVLSPDAVWLTIAGGVAQHVRLHAEELRPKLVRHNGRKRLTIVIDGPVPTDAQSWAELTDSFGKLLAAEVDDAALFECDFTTSTEVERTVGRIVMLDAYSPYFSLWLSAVCGIPSITLTGTVEDWRRIRARVTALEGTFGLEKWCRSLAPIADEFVRAAAGEADPLFWRRIYNPVDAYGGEMITGWVTRFYPYLKGTSVDVPNSMLDLPVGEPRDVPSSGERFYRGPGLRSTSVPATLSKVIVNLNDRVAGDNSAVALHGGLVGVTQDPDGALRPVAGWYLAPAPYEIGEVIDRLVREHDTAPAEERPWEGPAEMLALYGRLGAASLFDGAWRLTPAGGRQQIRTDVRGFSMQRLFDLSDGRVIAAATDYRADTTYWVVCRTAEVREDEWHTYHRLADAPQDVPLLGTSLAMLLDAAMDSGGDVAHLETGRLSDLAAGG
ncbi:DUF4419 domain-containing protein [Virgisporangium aliadipatigenens]|nr:DUF4419 domain-containing protein [Virgisporangium aliadipatigenens]